MAKLGTKKKPAVVRVKTQERAKEIASICTKHGWHYIIGIEPDKQELVSDIDRLLNSSASEITEKKLGRNDPCPCGSGKKYKKCCGK